MENSTRVSDGNNIDLSGTQLKKWEVNVSTYKQTDDQTRVLNFAVTPDKLPEELIVATEQVCRLLGL